MNVDIDGAPLIGPVPGCPGVTVAATANGYTLGPLVGREAATIALPGRARQDIAGLLDGPVHGRGDDRPMSKLKITAGPFAFTGISRPRPRRTRSPPSAVLPFVSQIVHVRWSGEGVWIPLGDTRLRRRLREPHQPPGAGAHHPLSRRHQRDRDPAGLWRGGFLVEDGPARRQPLHHADRRAGEPARARNMVLWKGAQPIRFEDD
jgi:hypothetical protein